MHIINYSRFSFLASMNGKMGFTQIINKTWSGIQIGPRPMKAMVLGCIVGVRKTYIALALGSTPWYSMHKICYRIPENIEKNCQGTNIYILSDSQAAIKALNNFQINSKLV
jgi:hypothetical protein